MLILPFRAGGRLAARVNALLLVAVLVVSTTSAVALDPFVASGAYGYALATAADCRQAFIPVLDPRDRVEADAEAGAGDADADAAVATRGSGPSAEEASLLGGPLPSWVPRPRFHRAGEGLAYDYRMRDPLGEFVHLNAPETGVAKSPFYRQPAGVRRDEYRAPAFLSADEQTLYVPNAVSVTSSTTTNPVTGAVECRRLAIKMPSSTQIGIGRSRIVFGDSFVVKWRKNKTPVDPKGFPDFAPEQTNLAVVGSGTGLAINTISADTLAFKVFVKSYANGSPVRDTLRLWTDLRGQPTAGFSTPPHEHLTFGRADLPYIESSLRLIRVPPGGNATKPRPHNGGPDGKTYDFDTPLSPTSPAVLITDMSGQSRNLWFAPGWRGGPELVTVIRASQPSVKETQSINLAHLQAGATPFKHVTTGYGAGGKPISGPDAKFPIILTNSEWEKPIHRYVHFAPAHRVELYRNIWRNIWKEDIQKKRPNEVHWFLHNQYSFEYGGVTNGSAQWDPTHRCNTKEASTHSHPAGIDQDVVPCYSQGLAGIKGNDCFYNKTTASATNPHIDTDILLKYIVGYGGSLHVHNPNIEKKVGHHWHIRWPYKPVAVRTVD